MCISNKIGVVILLLMFFLCGMIYYVKKVKNSQMGIKGIGGIVCQIYMKLNLMQEKYSIMKLIEWG